MNQRTIKTLGVAALGAAFAATGSGAASAADLGETLETTGRQVVSAPPVQEALESGDSVGRMPTKASDVVSPDMPSDVAAAEGGDSGPAEQLLGGLPLGQLSGDALQTDGATGNLGGALPAGGLGGLGLPLG